LFFNNIICFNVQDWNDMPPCQRIALHVINEEITNVKMKIAGVKK